MRNWSIPAGRLFGVEIRIHLTFLLLLVFVWLSESAAHISPSPERGMALVGIIFAGVVLHELGHALVGKHAGTPARAIILLPIGGVTIFDETQHPPEAGALTWKRDIRIALAGPMVNVVIALAASGIILAVHPDVHLLARPYLRSDDLPRSVVWANMWLAAFNLLPAYPMDGGRVLRAWFSRGMDPVRATRRAVSIGQTFATLFIILGMVQYMEGGGTEAAWLAVTGFFLLLGAQLEERSVVFQSVLETVQLEDIMLTDFATLSPADTLEDALEKAVHSLQDDFPVIRGTDMVGVVSKQKILQALRLEGNGYVQAVMNRIFEVAQKKETLASAFRKLTARNLSIIPVVEDQRLVGIVTLQNLMHSMALLAESRKLRKAALNS
ncbi:MAG: site-2 protease family protein [Acidobacteriaceae bacterium]